MACEAGHPEHEKLAFVNRANRKGLDTLIAEATVDCYNDSECVTGFYTMLAEHLATPFQTVVLGADITVTDLELTEDEQIATVCVRPDDTAHPDP
jgi:hypothetical protein